MSRFATHEGRSVDFFEKITAIPNGWRIIFDGLVHKGDMLMTCHGLFEDALDSCDGLDSRVDMKICVIRKMEKVEAVKPVVKKIDQKEFLNKLKKITQ